MKNALWMLVVAALAALTEPACSKSEAAKPATEQRDHFCVSDTLAGMLQFDTARVANLTEALHLTGEVSFDQDKVVRVMPLTSGQVLDVKVSLGDFVQRGQTLAVMKSGEIASNYGELSAARADLAIARKNMESTGELLKSGMAAERDYQNAKEEFQKAQSAVARAEELGKIYGASNAGGEIVIRSPIAGYVVEKKINAGQQVRTDDADNLFTISDLKEVWVLANVFESDIARVKTGESVNVTTLAYPDKVFTGKIDQVSQVLDPQNKTEKVRIRIPNPGFLLKPEMFANVEVSTTEPLQAVELPASALVFDTGKQYAVVYRDRCDVEVREVNVLKSADDRVFLRSGVKPGERVISNNEILVYGAFKE